MDENSLEGTIFTERVAHGYYILSRAAGLFVDSYEKNPVLLNYGIDELRFTKPVYPGAEIHIRFTCKEKTPQNKKEEDEIPKGIVKWLVEMIDETDELVGVATILTMVARKPGS
jgi:oxepin-CoA hydrolase/3-oxo-5,6-dehydrosuberyl-CoA semialdehyde dehydrogenase